MEPKGGIWSPLTPPPPPRVRACPWNIWWTQIKTLTCMSYWMCSHENESRSERHFGSRSTCIANAFPITIRICALRGNILFQLHSLRWLTHAWLQHGFSVHFQNAHTRITFRKSFAFTCPRIRLYMRITIQNTLFFCISKRVSKAWFETALRSQGLKSGFQIRKGSNHVPKRLSERDSFSCEHSHLLNVLLRAYLHQLGRWQFWRCLAAHLDSWLIGAWLQTADCGHQLGWLSSCWKEQCFHLGVHWIHNKYRNIKQK